MSAEKPLDDTEAAFARRIGRDTEDKSGGGLRESLGPEPQTGRAFEQAPASSASASPA